jgi:zinc D-Ala-D-Ala carboxypeptidase
MQISKHLSFKECTYSATAEKMGIANNNMTKTHIENMKLLAEKVFEPIREHFDMPIRVTSVFRSFNLNNAIKGSITSQHCSGQAMDIDMSGVEGISNKDIFNYIKQNLDFDQLIWEFGNSKEPDWIHVSYTADKNRKQILKAKKINGKTKYEII